MQQRQPRLGDVLDDYCPRERRLTNHVVVAMIGDDVKQTRCTTCDADHEYKHARIPRQRRKSEPSALAAPAAIVPKKVVHEVVATPTEPAPDRQAEPQAEPVYASAPEAEREERFEPLPEEREDREDAGPEEGPVHRQLIRAQLPRHDGQQPVERRGPDFTIRQPAGRPGRFRPRGPQRAGGGGMSFQGNSFNSNPRGGSGQRPQGGGPRHQGGGRNQGHKRSK